MENSLEVLKNIYDKKYNYENEKIDYKEIFSFEDERDKLEVLKDIVSFANTDGGYIIYGVTNNFEWKGLDDRSMIIDDIKIIDFARKYIDNTFKIKTGRYVLNDEEFYLLSIEKNENRLITFTKDGRYIKRRINGTEETKYVFKKNDQYGRVGSSSKPINGDELFVKRREINYGIVNNLSEVKRPYIKYIERPEYVDRIIEKMNNKNIRNVQINGLGGIGKTSLVIDFCEKIVDRKIKLNTNFHFIVWITGKKTLFLETGNIQIIRAKDISFNEVLEEFKNTFRISNFEKLEELSEKIFEIMKIYNTLVVFDNMETIRDAEILNFILKFPLNTSVIFTTRVNIEDLQYARIDIEGFEQKQFKEYLNNQIDVYNRGKENWVKITDTQYVKLYNLIQGSPIMTNMIAYKLANGQNTDRLIKHLNSMKQINSTYDSAMKFCFEEVFETFDALDKKILFLLSIPESNEEEFSIPDLIECTGEKEMVIQDKMDNLHNLSFCIAKNGNYSSPNLVKVFASKKLSTDNDININELKNSYYKLFIKKDRLNKMSDTFYANAKAYTYEEKNAAYLMKNLVDEFDLTEEKDSIIQEMDKLQQQYPDFAYIFFRRALFESSLKSPIEVIRKFFEKALELDGNNDHYWTEYAFFCEKTNRNEAIGYFKNAIQLNEKNYSAHHGLAVCLTKLYNNKDEFYSEKEVIINEFEKAYSHIDNIYWKKHNLFNAHAQATYLKNIKLYQDALKICETWLEKFPHEHNLLILEGQIKKIMDPEYVHPIRINNLKRGIFRDADDNILKDIINRTGYRNYSKNKS